jgi:hypothetical protein
LRLKQYAESVKQEFGFEPLGIDLHLDEGRYENGIFIRNYHAHVQFGNYCFEKRFAPLRHMMRKGKNSQGRTNDSNPHFEKLQDLVSKPFEKIGFSRGEQKSVTSREHLTKEEFVKNKQRIAIKQEAELSLKNDELKRILQRHTEIINSLEAQIEQKKSKLYWLESHIQKLTEVKDELLSAIKQKSKNAVRSVLRKNRGPLSAIRGCTKTF